MHSIVYKLIFLFRLEMNHKNECCMNKGSNVDVVVMVFEIKFESIKLNSKVGNDAS